MGQSGDSPNATKCIRPYRWNQKSSLGRSTEHATSPRIPWQLQRIHCLHHRICQRRHLDSFTMQTHISFRLLGSMGLVKCRQQMAHTILRHCLDARLKLGRAGVPQMQGYRSSHRSVPLLAAATTANKRRSTNSEHTIGADDARDHSTTNNTPRATFASNLPVGEGQPDQQLQHGVIGAGATANLIGEETAEHLADGNLRHLNRLQQQQQQQRKEQVRYGCNDPPPCTTKGGGGLMCL